MAEATALPNNQNAAGNTMIANQAAVGVNPIDTFMQSRVVRHFGRLGGLAIAVAIGMVVVLWSSEPNYSPLYSNVTGQDASQIAEVLTANEIEYTIDPSTGTVMVDQTRIAEARLKLAAKGLPQGVTKGMEMLQEDQSIGTSRFIENKRYNHALESELVRSIEAIRSIQKARVHLALPKQSIFIRNRTKPSASVVIKLYSGRTLNSGQVDAIVHLIASSIPLLESSQVTVIDQNGKLLTADSNDEIARTSKEFAHTRKIENNYVDRIINLLQPLVGEGKINAQVSAQLDFAQIESTREAYDPERSVIRSEQISESENRSFAAAIGIPGALSNQPPAAGTTDPEANIEAAPGLPGNQNRSATRNFEVDRVISHTRNPRGNIQRLSVAVVIDDKSVIKDDGSIEKVAYSDAEIESFSNLVKQSIGFDQNRGDSVSVINTSFISVIEEPFEEVSMLENMLNEAWVLTLIKQILGALGLLIVYFVFGRPFIKSLNPNKVEIAEQTARVDPVSGELLQGPGGAYSADDGSIRSAQPNNMGMMPNLSDDPNNPAALIRRGDATYEQKIEMARTLVMDDPARVANVMKHWVED